MSYLQQGGYNTVLIEKSHKNSFRIPSVRKEKANVQDEVTRCGYESLNYIQILYDCVRCVCFILNFIV